NAPRNPHIPSRQRPATARSRVRLLTALSGDISYPCRCAHTSHEAGGIMGRIGGIGSLSSGQLSALFRIRQIGAAIEQNTQRLSTLKRINSAKDDPAGLISATLLRQ